MRVGPNYALENGRADRRRAAQRDRWALLFEPSVSAIMRKIGICFALPALLAGCAAGTVKELKSAPGNSIHIEINQNCQRVYKNVLEKMQQCLGEGWGGAFAQYHVRHAIFSELQEANISWIMSNLDYQNHYLHVDLKGLQYDKTKLDAFVYFSGARQILVNVQAWATDANSTCDGKLPQPIVEEK